MFGQIPFYGHSLAKCKSKPAAVKIQLNLLAVRPASPTDATFLQLSPNGNIYRPVLMVVGQLACSNAAFATFINIRSLPVKDKRMYDRQCPRHREQYHLHQPEIRLLDGVLAVRLSESRMHFVRLGVSTLFVNDKRRDLLGRISCGSCSIDAR